MGTCTKSGIQMKGSHKEHPGWIGKFVEWYCKPELVDEILGDLLEQFKKNKERRGSIMARAIFILDSIRFLKLSTIKRAKLNPSLMIIRNYCLVAGRTFLREKSFTFTNILGLSLSICVGLFIMFWVMDELKYNQWPTDREKINYVSVNMPDNDGGLDTWLTTPQPLKAVLVEKYPSVKKVAITTWFNSMIFQKGEEYFDVLGHYASPEIFEIFDIPFIQGGHETMYEQSQSIAFSEDLALQYFGANWREGNIVGTTITDKDGEQYSLTGVFENLPDHSTLKFQYIIPFETRLKRKPWIGTWGNFMNRMYVELADGYTTETAALNIRDALTDNRPDETEEGKLMLQSFTDLYLFNNYENGKIVGGRIEYVRLLIVSAFLILVLAGFNFMNLASARSSKRSKEAGVRKVMGARKGSLRIQFIIESLLITITSAVVAVLMVIVLLPYFNSLVDKSISLLNIPISYWFMILLVIVILGIISGLYPAIYISSIHPIRAIKGIWKAGSKNKNFRRSLVVFQFVITMIMIIGSLTIYDQMQFIMNKNLGIDRENVIWVWEGNYEKPELKRYLEELVLMPGITKLTTTSSDPLNVSSGTCDPDWEGRIEPIHFNVLGIDQNFIPMMGIQLASGRNLDFSYKTDSSNYLINETAAKMMGIDDPLGEKLSFWGNTGKIIGVVKDFHIQSLHSEIRPLIMRYDDAPSYILVKADPNMISEAIQSLEKLHNKYQPEAHFGYRFLDDDYNKRYHSEQLVGKLSLYFTIVAIVISCIGLLSLVTYHVESKTKEFGIRKVLGASVTNLLGLIASEYFVLITIAIVIAFPVSLRILNNWMSNFAYNTGLSLWVFISAGLLGLGITFLTIIRQALKTATSNPVESIRAE